MKNKQIEVNGIQVSISEKGDNEYISLTDITRGFDGGFSLIEKWMRSKRTINYLGIWERLYNFDFNSPEFEGIKKLMENGTFSMSAKQWIEKTKAIGIVASAGRYGGTFAHKDIAIEFCSWLSPEFKLLLIKEFQRLKAKESESLNQEWQVKRIISKANYRIHTDSIKQNIVPLLTANEKKWVYAEEADILNIALFDISAKQWTKQNPDLSGNIRDYASIQQLTVLSNLESINAFLIKQGVDKTNRIMILRDTAIEQLRSLGNGKIALN